MSLSHDLQKQQDKEIEEAEKLSFEPPRDCRRPFGLSYAAMAGCSSMA
jgi:hypothetical protein